MSETVIILDKLMKLRDHYAGNLLELAGKLGLSRQRLSAYLNGQEPKGRVARDVEAVFKEVFASESGHERTPESVEARPLGHVAMKGRDWEMQVPFYADDAQTAIATRAAKALLNAVQPETVADKGVALSRKNQIDGRWVFYTPEAVASFATGHPRADAAALAALKASAGGVTALRQTPLADASTAPAPAPSPGVPPPSGVPLPPPIGVRASP